MGCKISHVAENIIPQLSKENAQRKEIYEEQTKHM